MHLHLPHDICWTIATDNVLFVRKHYAALLEKVLQCRAAKPGQIRSDLEQRRAVTGQPGIGKPVWI